MDCLALTVFYLVHSDKLMSLLLLSLVTPPLPSSHYCQSGLSTMSTVCVSLLLKTLLYHPEYICVPHPEPSSLLPPHTISPGRLSAPAPSIQYCTSNLDWRLVSYMILYMFQCHSPKSSHPLPLPQSPKDCSIHLCLFCCLVYRVIVTIFLNSIYMH